MFDLIIENAEIVDGSGNPAYHGDIGVEGDRIAECGGSLAMAESKRRIQADALTVTPGFIDAHAHSDAYLLLEPDAPSKISQGITTEINGQCGGSAVPRLDSARLPSDWNSQCYPMVENGVLKTADHSGPTWAKMAEYRELFEAVRPALNSVQFVGHNTLRAGVVGYEPRCATADEVKEMVRRLECALDEGCRGLSTGLLYQPGKYADAAEIKALVNALARRDAIYSTHMRSEGSELDESVEEVLELGRVSGAQIQISHIKSAGKSNWHKLRNVLERLREARSAGLRLFSDRYPYLASSTELDIVLPPWAERGGREAILSRLRDAETRSEIIEFLNFESGRDWSMVTIGGGWSAAVRAYCGCTVAEAAERTKLSAGELICRFILADEARTSAFFFGMCMENLVRILSENWIMPGSDASLRAPWGVLGKDHPHPRAYGTMPRYLRMMNGEVDGCPTLAPFEEAVRRMTSLPAQTFRLQDRGHISKNAYADLVVLDRGKLLDRADYADPHRFCEGICHTVVNGVVAYEGRGTFSGSRNGRLL